MLGQIAERVTEEWLQDKLERQEASRASTACAEKAAGGESREHKSGGCKCKDRSIDLQSVNLRDSTLEDTSPHSLPPSSSSPGKPA